MSALVSRWFSFSRNQIDNLGADVDNRFGDLMNYLTLDG